MESVATTPLLADRVVDVIDRTFRVYRNNFIVFISLVALVSIPIALLQYYVEQEASQSATEQTFTFGDRTYTTTSRENSTELGIVQLLSYAVQIVVINGLLTVISSENYLGRRVGLGQAFGLAKGRFLTLLGGLILYGILGIIALIAIGIGTNMCVVPLILFPVAAYLLLATFFFMTPVIMLEAIGPRQGLRRALELGKIRFWSVFGFVIGIWIISLIINAAFGSAAGLLVFSSNETTSLVGTLLSTLVSIFIAPILPVGLTMMYYNIRTRVEGLDLALAAVDKPEPRPSDVASPEPEYGWLTGRDVVNILILTGVVVLLVCGLWMLVMALVGSAT